MSDPAPVQTRTDSPSAVPDPNAMVTFLRSLVEWCLAEPAEVRLTATSSYRGSEVTFTAYRLGTFVSASIISGSVHVYRDARLSTLQAVA